MKNILIQKHLTLICSLKIKHVGVQLKEYASEKIKLSDFFIFLRPGLENGPRPTRRPRASCAQAANWAWAGFLSARLGQIWPVICRPSQTVGSDPTAARLSRSIKTASDREDPTP